MPSQFKQIQHPLLAILSHELNRYKIGLVSASIDQKLIQLNQVTHTLHLKLMINLSDVKPVIHGHRYPFAEWVGDLTTWRGLPMEPFDLTPGQGKWGKWHITHTEVYMEHGNQWFLNVTMRNYEDIKPTSIPIKNVDMHITIQPDLNMNTDEPPGFKDWTKPPTHKSFAREYQGQWVPGLEGINRSVDPNKLADMKGTPLTPEVIEEATRFIASQENCYDPRMGRGYTRRRIETDEEQRARVRMEEIEAQVRKDIYSKTQVIHEDASAPGPCVKDKTISCSDCGDCMKKNKIERTDTYWRIIGAKSTSTK